MDGENNRLKWLVDRILEIDEDIKARNEDKRDVFAEAKSIGYDVKALKETLRRLRRDPAERTELETLVETYMAALDTPARTRARAREEATTNAG